MKSWTTTRVENRLCKTFVLRFTFSASTSKTEKFDVTVAYGSGSPSQSPKAKTKKSADVSGEATPEKKDEYEADFE
jgi:hypothetical protein